VPSPEQSAGNLLLVEGRDDQQVVRRVCEPSGLAHSFRIEQKDGIDALVRSIGAHLQEPDLCALGILADSNADPSGRWQGISDRLSRAGIAVPRNLDSGGTIIEGEIRVGVWLMPNNDEPGELEDFVRSMIRDHDQLWQRAETYIDDIPAEVRRFPSTKATKAKVHAWLVSCVVNSCEVFGEGCEDVVGGAVPGEGFGVLPLATTSIPHPTPTPTD